MDARRPDPLPELDFQQLALLEVLERSADSRASFDELRETGIEFPASIAEELELMGLPLEHCSLRRAGTNRPGVRLYSTVSLAAAGDERVLEDAPALPRPAIARAQSAPGADRAPIGARLTLHPLAAALAVLAVVVVVLALIGGGAGRGPLRPERPLAARPPAAARAATSSSAPAAAHAIAAARRARRASAPVHTPATERAASVPATELQARGHELLEAGQAGTAALRLSEALRATGERVSDCIQPSSESCLTYAYALYDLGRALAAEGHAGEAAAVLRRRLRIDNQREVVASELERLRASASGHAMPRSRTRRGGAGAVVSPPNAGGVQAPGA